MIRAHRQHHDEKGASAVIAVLLIAVLGGFLALVINSGHVMSVRTQLQNRVDAAALAGSMDIDGTPQGLNEAFNSALDYAERYKTDREFVPIQAGDIVLGVWDYYEPNRDLAFTPRGSGTPIEQINAVLVRSGRQSARGNPLQVAFSLFLNQETADVSAEAVAVAGGPGVACSVPLAFADCQIKNPDGSLNCDDVLEFHSSPEDNIGFTSLIPGLRTVSVPLIKDALDADCMTVAVGDMIGIQNGVPVKPLVPSLNAFIARNGTHVVAPIISPDTCPDPQFNRLQPVVGFASFTIVEVVGPPEKVIKIRMDCEQEGGGDGGPAVVGEYWGTWSPVTQLVR